MSFPSIALGKPALVLAPMEGVTDAPMRALLTERDGFTFCVSEFLRISHALLPDKVFFEHVPELRGGCQTPSGTPIQFQLLGGHEERLASSALQAVRLGAQAIDLNFGCPAPTVNRHDGGAAILKTPARVRSIVHAVRQAVPQHIPVSAKLRLGWENMEDIFVNAEQAVLGGASWITIHARTRLQGYVPPAHWQYIAEARKRVGVSVVANGEIWSREDFLRCREVTGCEHFMIGRGAMGNPNLSHEIAQELGIPLAIPRLGILDTRDWVSLLKRFSEIVGPQHSNYTLSRIKQWLRYAKAPLTQALFTEIRRTQTLDEAFAIVDKEARIA